MSVISWPGVVGITSVHFDLSLADSWFVVITLKFFACQFVKI